MFPSNMTGPALSCNHSTILVSSASFSIRFPMLFIFVGSSVAMMSTYDCSHSKNTNGTQILLCIIC